MSHIRSEAARDVGFAVQEALARNDRRVLAEIAPCVCDENEDNYDFSTVECPAKVWNGCHASFEDFDDFEEVDSRGPLWGRDRYYEGDCYETGEWDVFPDAVTLSKHMEELNRLLPAGWSAAWEDRGQLVISHEASERASIIAISEEGDLIAVVGSSDMELTYEALEPIRLPPVVYFTPAWIMRILQSWFLKYHP